MNNETVEFLSERLKTECKDALWDQIYELVVRKILVLEECFPVLTRRADGHITSTPRIKISVDAMPKILSLEAENRKLKDLISAMEELLDTK